MASPSSGRTFTGERMDEDVNFPACLKAARVCSESGGKDKSSNPASTSS